MNGSVHKTCFYAPDLILDSPKCYHCSFPEVIIITTKEVQKALSTDQRLKTDVKMRLDVVCIQEEADMGTADALRHIQQKIKVRQVSIS